MNLIGPILKKKDYNFNKKKERQTDALSLLISVFRKK